MLAKKIVEPLAQLATLLVLTAACALVAWECWPHVGRWHKRHLATQLAAQIDSAPDEEARILVHELAALGTVAIDELVAHTLSPRVIVAETARTEVNDALANHRILLARKGHERDAEALVRLAEALAENSEQFGPVGRRWAESMMLKLIDLTEQVPPAQASIILDHSSTLLANIPPNGPRQQSLESSVSQSVPQESAVAASPTIDLHTLAVPSEAALARSTPPANQPPAQKAAPPVTQHKPATTPEPQPAKVDRNVTTLPWVSSGKSSLSVEVDDPKTQENSTGLVDVPSPLETQQRIARMRGLSTRVLLEKLAHADRFMAGPIRHVLELRGVSRQEIELTATIFASDISRRLELVEQTAKLPAATARRILRLMLEDSHADVRLLALSTLATTDDPQLPALAKEITIRDKDPRVADLAEELMRR